MTPINARPPTTPPTMPPIVPPDIPLSSLTEITVDVEVDGVVVAEAGVLENEDVDEETEIEDVGVACSCAREIGKEDAEGVADESEEKVSFSFVSEMFSMGFSTVYQQKFI